MPPPLDSNSHVRHDSTDVHNGAAEPLPGANDDFGFRVPSPDATAFGPGSRLGNVTIVRLIAEGGMGRVYEGRQAAPARTVAVKILREGLVTPTGVRRFQHEADVLGRLVHPGIARIYAADIERSSVGDQPYFIMEFVADATPLTDFASSRALSVRERVGLFASVAAAVAAAHREGVVHRDLKPSNILASPNGDPKVIDFGVARAIDSAGDRLTVEADFGRLVGTVRFMAPEQLGVHGSDADARSDVYSLGLVFHELLFHELPYELGGRSLIEAASILAARTGGGDRALARRIRALDPVADAPSSLAVILATCLEPRPADRYQTARDLASDLERWLAGEPIEARPPTLFESMARLARRHRVAATALTAALACLVTAVGMLAWAWQTAERQRDVAIRAQAAAGVARQVADEQRAAAEARATEIRRQLYFSTVQLAAEARDRDNLTEARRLLAEARALAPGVAPHPIELDYLAASLDDSLAMFDAREGTVTAVAVSGDGTAVAGGTDRGRVFMWKPGHAETTVAQLDGPVWAVAISPDASCIAIGSSDGRVQIHDAGTSDVIMNVSAHDGTVYAIAFSPDGRLLATASRDRSVRLWDTSSCEPRGDMVGHEGTVLSVCFAPDGDRLLTTSSDGTARIWSVADGAQILRVGDGSSRLFRGVWSPDGRRFATAAEDGKAHVRDAGGGRLRATFVHPHRVNSIAFIDDGTRLVTASGDAVLRTWNITSGTLAAQRRGHADGIWSLAASPASGSRGHDAGVPRTIVVTGSADGTVRTWDLGASGEPIVELGSRGISVATGGATHQLAVGSAMGEVWLVDPTMLRAQCRLTGLTDRVNSIAFSPDGLLMAAADDAGTIHRWTLPDAKPFPSALVLHVRRAFDVGFSPDGKTMATAGEDRTARLVDSLTGEDRVPPLKHPARVFRATFSPDGRLVATACEDRHVRLWEAATGRKCCRWGGHARAVNWVAFAPDGLHMASASSDGTVRVWPALPTNAPPAPMVLTGPSGQVWKVAFSPDGSRIAATAADGLVHLWDTATGRPVTVLRGHRDATWGLAFSRDGHALATASWDGTLRLWGVPMITLATARKAADE